MKHKLSKRILSTLLAMMMLVCLLSTSVLPVFAATITVRDTISSVAITVGNLVAGEPLATCVPESTLCEITCTWAVRGRNGTTEVPASTIADAGTTYYLAMVLTPKLDLYTFADSVTGTVNGNTVTIEPVSSTKVACMVSVSPVTRETEISVSVPQPAVGVIPGTPTAIGGHAVTDCTWWRSSAEAVSPETELGENEVFSTNYDYYMEATVTAASGSLFDESTAISVNGEAAEILERGTNTIRFRYHVDSSEVTTVASQVYVADGNGGYWTLTSGDTKTNGGGYTASYQDGVLTLSNIGESTISGFYNKSTLYYGIYAEGNLTVRFEGDFRFDLSGTPDTADYVYGIYVNGDLILINGSADNCTVSFSPAEGILATTHSSGIYCEGALSIQNVGGGFTLNAHGVGVRPVGGEVIANFTNNGICAQGGITIGSNCTVNATAADVQLSAEGETKSRGIYAYGGFTIMKNAVVTATGGDINPSQSAETLSIGFSQYCYGVEVEGGDITVNGGTLTAIGGNIDYGDLTGSGNATYGQQESYGIYAANITLNGGAITATAGFCRSSAYVTGSLSVGVFCYDLTVSSGTLTATADDAWWESTGLHVRNNLSQTGGTIIGTGDLAVCAGDTTGTGSRGIYVVNTLTASGGSLTGTGGTMGGNPFPSVGLQTATINLSGTAEVAGIGGLTTKGAIDTPLTGSTSFANYPGDSIGVWTHNDLTVDGNAVLTAIGGTVKGDRSSAAQAMSIGLNFRLAEGFAISGSGTVIATGGETHYGSKGNNLYDSSCGIYGDVPSLTIDGTTVTATGGSVSTQTVSGNGVTIGGVSYGLYLPSGGLTLQNGAELTATGGENPNFSTLSTQPSKHNDSYGAYIKGDITVTNSVLTAIGGLSKRTVGLLHGGAVTLSGVSSRLTASADAYHSSAADEKYSYGAMNGSDFETWPGGAYTVNGGILILQGQTGAMSYTTNNTLTAVTILHSANQDGSNPISVGSPANFSVFSSSASKYVKADSNTVQVTVSGWTYGDAASTPTYTDYDGEPTIRWTGTTRAGASYSSDTAPTDAGSYTVTVTYPGGQTGSADFTVAPRSLTQCVWSLDDSELTYNGSEQTMGVTVSCGGEELVEGTDYTVSGNKQTNAGYYTLTINGIGNIEGARDIGFTIFKKRPTAEDFNIPEIVEYAYTGNPVELPLPTLKEGYTGVGTITLYYNSEITPPTDMGEYAVWFDVTEGDNFLNNHSLDYGTLVIRPAGFAVIVDIEDWTYGGTPKTPTYTEYDGEPAILWNGTTRAGASYSSDTAPTDAGSYTVTVTYPGGQTGSADFTVHPKQFIQYCSVSRNTASLTYNGSEQTMGVTVNYGEEVLVEGVDYTVSGNKQTNAGSYTITVTGIGNLAGTKTINFEIDKKFPTIDDFNIPEIAEYAYTGNPVELPLPTLKAPYTGGGTITLSYNSDLTQPTDMGEYTVRFRMTGNTNFYDSNYFEYGTLVIKPAGFAVIVEIGGWTYGGTPKTPTYTDYDGEPTIRWTGITRAGAPYSSDAAPTDAGSYTVTVTYPGGQTGSADFTVEPKSIGSGDLSLDNEELTYNGTEQTVNVTVTYDGEELAEGVDYTVSGNKQTNADDYTIMVNGIGNFEGTNRAYFVIYKKRPTAEDFNIPEIAEYTYTGNPVELPLPTLKAPYTGGGEVTLLYNTTETPIADIGEYPITFSMAEGTNFYASISSFEYGTLVIKAADISSIVLRDLNAPQAGKTPDTDVTSGYPALYTVSNVRWLDAENAEVNGFEEGKFYAVEFTISATYIGGYDGDRFNFTDAVTASLDENAVIGDGSSVTKVDAHTVNVRYKFPTAAAPADTTVSGTVTSFGSETADVVIALFAEGSATADYTVIVKGNSAEYAIEGVADGNYTLRATKAYHLVAEKEITVSGNTVQDIALVLGNDGKQFKFNSAYLNLTQDINFVYVATIPEGFTNPYVVFTMNGENYTVTESTLDDRGRNCFKFLGVNPQWMGDNISATVYATVGDIEVSFTQANYSIKQYCKNQLSKTTDNELKTLLSDLLVYGEKAQYYQDYKTGELVTADMTLYPSTFVTLGSEYNKQAVIGDKNATIDYGGAGLYLSNNVAIRYTINTLTPEKYTYEITIKGNTRTFTAADLQYVSEGKYYLFFDGIMATEFDELVTAQIKQDGVLVGRTIEYSVNTYIQKYQNDAGALGALLRAVYNYGNSAIAYAD